MDGFMERKYCFFPYRIDSRSFLSKYEVELCIIAYLLIYALIRKFVGAIHEVYKIP